MPLVPSRSRCLLSLLLTLRGIHPGQFLNLHGGPGYGGGVTRGVVKSLEYDSEIRGDIGCP